MTVYSLRAYKKINTVETISKNKLLYLLCLAIISQFFFVEFDIGVASPRVYLIYGTLILILLRISVTGESLFRTHSAKKLAIIYLGFVFWLSVCRYANDWAITSILHGLVATHLIALSQFISMQFIIRRPRHVTILTSVIIFTCIVSGFIGIMQWFDFQWAWEIWRKFHPNTMSALVNPYLWNRAYIPGLAEYSIPFSYHMISFGMPIIFLTLWVFLARRGFTIRVFLMVGSFIVLTSTLVSQCRSAVYSLVFSFLAVSWYLFFKSAYWKIAQAHWKSKVKISISFLLIVFFLFSSILITNSKIGGFIGSRSYSLDRIFGIRDPERKQLALFAIEMVGEAPLFGPDLKNYTRANTESDKAPHNLFLNAMIYSGLTGLCIIIFLLGQIYQMIIKKLKSLNMQQINSWIVFGCIAGLLAHTLNSLFHNSSFVTGATIPWWLLGVISAKVIERPNSKIIT